MLARNHEVTAKQQLLDANGNIAETVLDAFPMGKLQMPTNSSEEFAVKICIRKKS